MNRSLDAKNEERNGPDVETVVRPVSRMEVVLRIAWGAVFVLVLSVIVALAVAGLLLLYQRFGPLGPAALVSFIVVSYFSGIALQWLRKDDMWGRRSDLFPKRPR